MQKDKIEESKMRQRSSSGSCDSGLWEGLGEGLGLCRTKAMEPSVQTRRPECNINSRDNDYISSPSQSVWNTPKNNMHTFLFYTDVSAL